MPPEVLLTVALVLGFLIAAGAVMAVLAWALVACFRAREKKRGAGAGSEQSPVIADGVFALDEDGGLLGEDAALLDYDSLLDNGAVRDDDRPRDGDGALRDEGRLHGGDGAVLNYDSLLDDDCAVRDDDLPARRRG
ncbi:hypothetical protein [Cumulibacter manganitolerans]|uniref:hypothetical protein n=1 Tax=Cumulibacter manganitolerans TaxID=1884992 RepID=UPI00129805C5|nr:hypothetical protein [Cumulibacter manganitolerans]